MVVDISREVKLRGSGVEVESIIIKLSKCSVKKFYPPRANKTSQILSFNETSL